MSYAIKQQQLRYSQTHIKMAMNCVTTETTTLANQFANGCISKTVAIKTSFLTARFNFKL